MEIASKNIKLLRKYKMKITLKKTLKFDSIMFFLGCLLHMWKKMDTQQIYLP